MSGEKYYSDNFREKFAAPRPHIFCGHILSFRVLFARGSYLTKFPSLQIRASATGRVGLRILRTQFHISGNFALMRRLVAAAEAKPLSFGGVSIAARASGLSRGTVIRGMAELKAAPKLPRDAANPARRCWTKANRRSGCDLEAGFGGAGGARDAWRPLVSVAVDLQKCAAIGGGTHQEMQYSLQANRNTLEGSSHPLC